MVLCKIKNMQAMIDEKSLHFVYVVYGGQDQILSTGGKRSLHSTISSTYIPGTTLFLTEKLAHRKRAIPFNSY